MQIPDNEQTSVTPIWAFYRAAYGLRTPYPKGEPAIAQDAYYSYRYAFDVIKGRFIAGEPTISQHAEWAYNYAREIIKDRWVEAEPAIIQSEWAKYYFSHFQDQFTEHEKVLWLLKM